MFASWLWEWASCTIFSRAVVDQDGMNVVHLMFDLPPGDAI